MMIDSSEVSALSSANNFVFKRTIRKVRVYEDCYLIVYFETSSIQLTRLFLVTKKEIYTYTYLVHMNVYVLRGNSIDYLYKLVRSPRGV